ncbi:protein phosphatase 1 regulatory subunit 12C-like isoform X2 [Varroa destructor]|uniref:cGMP-dependent protein kinase interacting domain-containing protein n=1 Tax=Varroa destructor TaxID=109461 RepID=A0A7M7KWF2_VARDE|nr:protein phosphatase 1 regulatory subunit 12C-like isoform X2 [Varroa destructor]
MALQGSAKEARAKRKEQLRLWEESETNLVDLDSQPTSRPAKSVRVKFNEECMFLAACAAGDKDEVDRLLAANRANINTVNVDGLTALHQACIDNNLEMAEFLIERGIDLNRGDNEGWTPLHATASCGYVSIAQLLLEKGARLDVVNVDNELAIDRAEEAEMKALLEKEASKRGIDADSVRQQEQKRMLEDVKKALSAVRAKSGPGCQPLVVDTRTGATALHVAAAKGYSEVVHVLLKEAALRSSSLQKVVHCNDLDGWTPLHAAAHWAQKEVCEMLVKEGLADMDKVTHSGQTVADVCDESLTEYLEDLRAKRPMWIEEREKMYKEHREIESPPHEVVTLSLKPMPAAFKRRSSVTRMSVGDRSHLKDLSAERISEHHSATATELRDNACIPEEQPSVEATFELPAPPPLPRSEPPPLDGSTPSTPGSVSSPNSINASATSGGAHSPISLSSSGSVSTTATLNLSSASSTNNSVAGVKRSFVAPVRDEESETQRKAHAKRVRETRRSTQGVTLEDIKSAEEHLKGTNDPSAVKSVSDADCSATIHIFPPTTAPLPSMELGSDSSLERRTSWRERAAAEQRQRQIEDAPHLKIVDSIEAVHHNTVGSMAGSNNKDNNSNSAAASPLVTQSPMATGGVTTPDTEDDSLTAQAATNSRTRRRAKRRSTGICSQASSGGSGDQNADDTTKTTLDQLEAENTQARLAISAIQLRSQSSEKENASSTAPSDYKKLYEQEQSARSGLQKELESARKEKEHLRELLSEKEELVLEVKKKLEHERSRRLEAENNLRDVQNDIRNVDTLKKKIDLMQEENAALIRVISKLSINTSHSSK